jgi:large subunit ribosomal protein L24
MYLKKGDTVVVTTGRDKNKEGVITQVLSSGKVVIEGINVYKKHAKSGEGIVEKEMAIDASNVALVDPTTKKATKVRFEIKDGKKSRISKASGKEI